MTNAFFDTEVETALKVIRDGGVILYPTDTIWGLGCDATNHAAIAKIFKIKKRADEKSMIILLPDERSVLQYVAGPDPTVFDFLEEQSRPTTVIFDHALGLPDNLVANDGSIGIRIVNDTFCRHLVLRLKKPLVSTSANISGTPSPQQFSDISEEIKSQVDHIVQWRQDDHERRPPSQIIRWENGQPRFLRS